MNRFLKKEDISSLVATVALFVVYVATAEFGLSLHPVHTFATLIWPPTGIALAVMLLYGYRVWPAIFLGATLVNLLTGAPLLAAFGIGVGNTLEALINVYVLRHIIGFSNSFGKIEYSSGFIVSTVFIATPVSALIGVGSLILSGTLGTSDFYTTFLAWWIGDILGAFAIAPLLIVWLPTRWEKDLSKIKYAGVFESLALTVFLIALGYFLFWTPYVTPANISFLYLSYLPLIWATFRFGARGKTITLFGTSSIAILAVIFGYGPFSTLEPNEGLFSLQVFLGVMATTFLVFASIMEERETSMRDLRESVSDLEDALKRIRLEDQAKSDFLAVLAHELRNPLAPVMSSLELMRMTDDLSNTDFKEMVVSMEKQMTTISKLLDDLLDISRISKKKLKLKKEVVDLKTVITSSVRSVTFLINKRSHSISLDVPKEPVFVDADPLRLEQALVNLLTNAAKYTDPGGHISILLKKEKELAFLSVKDNGIGIPEEMLPKIFETFWQAREHSSKGQGLGVGLSLTRSLVRLHEGTIEALSEGAGKGSEFIIRIPRLVNKQLILKQSKEKAPVPSSNPTENSRIKVLVVDDNEAAAQGIAKLLSYKSYDVRIAHDGSSGLEAASSFVPDAVLLDIGLPDMDGYEVARRMGQLFEKPPLLIALTGYGQERDKLNARNAKFDHHLTKPVAIAAIEKLLHTIKK